jgi:AcrR family transcriptional regulator
MKRENRQRKGTKQIILDTALTLFSQKGYSAVSIRDICGQIGIKESAIYYHFKNKKDIFDVLCASFTKDTFALQQEFQAEQAKAFTVSEKDFVLVCKSFVNDYLMDENINRFIRMLILEQNGNEQAHEIYRKMIFEYPEAEHAKIFAWLVHIRFLRNVDIALLVADYYTPLVYLFHKYLVVGTITEDVRKAVNDELERYVGFFLKKYKI